MARRATFSSRSFKPSLINSYGLEMFFCLLVCVFFFFSSNQKNDFFISIKYYVISFSEPGLKIITLPFEYINKSFYYLNDKFGGNPRKFGCFFKEFVKHIYITFYHCISGDSLNLHVSRVEEYRQSIWQNLVSKPAVQMRRNLSGELEAISHLCLFRLNN